MDEHIEYINPENLENIDKLLAEDTTVSYIGRPVRHLSVNEDGVCIMNDDNSIINIKSTISPLTVNKSNIKPYKIKPMYDEYYISRSGLENEITLVDNTNHKVLFTQLYYSLITGFEFAMKKFEVEKIDEETMQNKINEIQ